MSGGNDEVGSGDTAERSAKKEEAEKLKVEGNGYFKAEQYLKAAALFTKAIKLDPENAVLFSNRSAAFRLVGKLTRSLEDAEECVRLKPEWSKGYFRMSLTLCELERYEEALNALKSGSAVDGDSREIKQKMVEIQKKLKAAEDRVASEALLQKFEPTATEGDKFLAEVLAKLRQPEGTSIDITLHLPNASTIGVERGFDSPNTLQECVEHLRKEVQERKQTMACMVVRKKCIAYPQVWVNKQWPFGDRDGFLMQLHTENRREQKVLFLEKTASGVGDAFVLPFDQFKFMPDLVVENLGQT